MARWRRGAALVALAALAGLGLVACGDDDGAGTGDAGAAAADDAGAQDTAELEGSITVFAAASLTDAFGELATAFEDEHPGTTVELNFAGSSALREQILAGAPADVFASANQSNMDQVAEADAVAGEPEPFVTNELEIAVPAGNPGGVDGLDDFAQADLLLGLCAAEVPCGEFGREALASAGVEPAVDTEEPDVRSLLTKIEAGELDAGIVYHTDVLAAGDEVEGVEIPAEHNVTATYPIAALADAGEPEVAAAFVDFVLSPAGQEVLESFGFGAT